MLGGALGIAFVIAKLGVALATTSGIVTGVSYFNNYKKEWDPKKKPGSRSNDKSYDGGIDDDEFKSMRKRFPGGY